MKNTYINLCSKLKQRKYVASKQKVFLEIQKLDDEDKKRCYKELSFVQRDPSTFDKFATYRNNGCVGVLGLFCDELNFIESLCVNESLKEYAVIYSLEDELEFIKKDLYEIENTPSNIKSSHFLSGYHDEIEQPFTLESLNIPYNDNTKRVIEIGMNNHYFTLDGMHFTIEEKSNTLRGVSLVVQSLIRRANFILRQITNEIGETTEGKLIAPSVGVANIMFSSSDYERFKPIAITTPNGNMFTAHPKIVNTLTKEIIQKGWCEY